MDVELEADPQPLGDLRGYGALRALVRLHGDPVGHVEVPLLPGSASYAAGDLRRVILRRLTWPILRQHLLNRAATPLLPGGIELDELLSTSPPGRADNAPLVTVVVCTRDRAEDLSLCLDALVRLDYPNLDILVVDNAPSNEDTKRLVENSYPRVRYAREERPGLDWARNRAIQEARGEILAYTDDDVVVDPGWAAAIVGAFGDPWVMAVTGLTVPYELETDAQVLFERYGGFGRGYRSKHWRMPGNETKRLADHLGGGQYGAGANMAFRREVFEHVGLFDPALDVGTVTNGGGDTEMFFRVLKEGHALAYEPRAMVRHRHRREYQRFRKQLSDNSIGLYSYLVRTALAYPDARLAVVWFALWWFWYWNVRRLLGSFLRPSAVPRELILTEMWNSFVGLGRYFEARRVAGSVVPGGDLPVARPPGKPRPRSVVRASTGVRTVDLGCPLHDLEDVSQHTAVRVYVRMHGELVGFADIRNLCGPLGRSRLRDEIVEQTKLALLRRRRDQSPDALWPEVLSALERRYLPSEASPVDEEPREQSRLPEAVKVSVVIPTYDRPHDLRACLLSLTTQETGRSPEIVVVDNHPASGLTSPVVAEFPGVVLVNEERPGRAYASNRGFAAARGEVIASIDDDMVAPPDWLENLLRPLARPDVAAVTGNTLPLDLDTRAQRLFEEYGAFWRGVVSLEADDRWFGSFRRRAVPTWNLGGSGNTAFRSAVLADPQIGPMDEALGAGTATGTGEDIYFFYKVLAAGYAISYEPSACAWHRHRREMGALQKQLYNYSKGHVAYHLTTLLRDRDPRAVSHLVLRLPRWHAVRIARYAKRRLLFRRRYPLRLILTEIWGNLAGPWCLWRSRRRVKRDGSNHPAVPAYSGTTPDERARSLEGDTQIGDG